MSDARETKPEGEKEGKKERRGLLDWLWKPADHPGPVVPVPGIAAEAQPACAPPQRAAESDPAQRFVDRGEVGRGGMSSIRRVQDQRLVREVAMKVLDPELATHPVLLQSFIEEAQITGQLDHPHIVPVHDIHVDGEGSKHFTMKLVRGLTLTAWLDASPKQPGSPERLNEALDVYIKICDAVSFAHSRGVIHRDIKPDNIMVGPFGEVYLMDWGLARLGTGSSPLPHAIEVTRPPPPRGARRFKEGVVGTPAYMPPEQAEGDAGLVDERTDVFALGAVLYHIVCGCQPYFAATVEEALAKARVAQYPPPEEVVTDWIVPPGISRIIRKAMSRFPADRYQSSAELKDDVQGFLRGGLHLPSQTFAPGTRICVEGERGDAAYLITRGRCKAYKTRENEQHLLREMGPGAVFGETAVISNLPRTATVEAIDQVTALVVTRAMLEEGLGLDTWMGSFVKALALRFRELDEKFTNLENETMRLRGAQLTEIES